MILPQALVLVLVATKQAYSEYDNIKKLSSANNEFALKLHKLFSPTGNAFTSPASIFVALGMLYEGARGSTAEEIRSALSYNTAGLNDGDLKQYFQELLSLVGTSEEEYRLDIANAIVSSSNFPVLQEYKDILQRYYGAVLNEVDFFRDNNKAVNDINKWVSDKTGGKITKLLESLDSDTVLVLLNAVYFKGTWKTQFSPSTTIESSFYNNGVEEVSVQMMGAKNRFLYGDFREYGVQALRMPYVGEDISMLVLLPYSMNGLSKVEQELTSSKLSDIISQISTTTVIVNFPKFKLEDNRELNRNLTNLGMRSAFVNGANFAGISEEGNLKVSNVIHKSVIEVNEEGSEVAGVSAILIIPYSSFSSRIQHFYANHPFLFFIMDDRTGMILFYGRVNEL